jgi:hypothetical protein
MKNENIKMIRKNKRAVFVSYIFQFALYNCTFFIEV